jgi:hypothetical protein
VAALTLAGRRRKPARNNRASDRSAEAQRHPNLRVAAVSNVFALLTFSALDIFLSCAWIFFLALYFSALSMCLCLIFLCPDISSFRF